VPFQIPSLRQHLEDIPALVKHFNALFAAKNHRPAKYFTDSAIESLQHYDWPGNVRELRNIVERLVIMHQKPHVEAIDLPLGKSDNPTVNYHLNNYYQANEAYEREFILRKLAESQSNVSKAAEMMGLDRSQLYRRMKALGIANRV
jgi:two-component system nitrogen regulation response regulator NtrX